jgi:tape measure domain-containing protein
MAENRANLKTVISADSTQFNSALNGAIRKGQVAGTKIASGIGRASSAMAGLAARGIAAGAAIAGAAAAAALFKGSKLAASMESTAVAFESLTGSADTAKKVLEELRVLGAETPFEFPELADAGRKLIAFGEGADTVAETLRRVGDVSSSIGAPISEIAEIYGKARVQGRLFGEDINQLTGRGIPVIGALADQFGVMDEEVRDLVSEGKVGFKELEAAFVSMTSEGGFAFDAMEKQSKTFNGKLSNLADAVGNLLTKFGAPINDALGPYISQLTNEVTKMTPIFAKIGRDLADRMPEIIDGIGKFINGAIIAYQVFLRIGEFLGKTFGALFSSDFWNAAGNIIGGALLGALDTFTRSFFALFAGMKASFMMLGAILADALVTALMGFTALLEKIPGASLLLGDLPEQMKGVSDGLKKDIVKNNPLDAMEKEFKKKTKLGEMAEDMIVKGMDGMTPFVDSFAELLRDFDTIDFSKFTGAGKDGSNGDSSNGETYGFPGLEELYQMQQDKAGGINVGENNVFSKDRNRLGIATTGLSKGDVGSGSAFNQDRKRLGIGSAGVTGGLGEKRRLATSKDDKDAKKGVELQKTSNDYLDEISKGIKGALSVN